METGKRLAVPTIRHGTYELVNKNGQRKDIPFAGHDITEVSALPLGATDAVEREVNGQWQLNVRGEHFPHRLGSNEDARQAVKQFEFPEALRHEALRHASRLAWALNEESGPRLVRRQCSGRFDPQAAGRMLNAVRGGTYSPEATRPFVRQHRVSTRRPHVAIVAAGNWGAMWGDEQYIPNAAILSLAVSWACESLGCLTTSALLRNVMDHCQNQRHLGIVWLSRPDISVPLSGYAAMFHRELFRCGTMLLDHAHPYHVQVMKGMSEPEAMRFLENGSVDEGADEEFRGVAWARAQGATIVVSIGNFKDNKKADVSLNAGLSLEMAIGEIADRLAEQRRKAA